MSDKYQSLTKNLFLCSTVSITNYPRTKRLKQEGASIYQVINNKLVRNNKTTKCNQVFYDTKEWIVQQDSDIDNNWSCVVTRFVNTFDTTKKQKIVKKSF